MATGGAAIAAGLFLILIISTASISTFFALKKLKKKFNISLKLVLLIPCLIILLSYLIFYFTNIEWLTGFLFLVSYLSIGILWHQVTWKCTFQIVSHRLNTISIIVYTITSIILSTLSIGLTLFLVRQVTSLIY